MELIDKSCVVAEIKRQILAIDNVPKITDTQISVLSGNKVILTKLLSFIDTIEVKYVPENLIGDKICKKKSYTDIEQSKKLAEIVYTCDICPHKGNLMCCHNCPNF